MKAIDEYKAHDSCRKRANMFCINAAAGTGKTYLYKAIMHEIRARNEIVIPISWTGISASLLAGGRTVHSVFRLGHINVFTAIE